MVNPSPFYKRNHPYLLSSIGFLARKLIAVLLLLVSSIGYAQQSDASQDFVPIFNGKDFAGWHISKTNHHGTMGNFFVEDGALVMKQYPYGQGESF